MDKNDFAGFSATEVNAGLAYAKGEFGIELNSVLLVVLASIVHRAMAKTRTGFTDTRSEVIDRAFRVEFKRVEDTDQLRREIEAYSAALGKMFNNRQNSRRPNFSPAKRISPKRDRGPKLVSRSDGQAVMAL